MTYESLINYILVFVAGTGFTVTGMTLLISGLRRMFNE